jgi:hypothetical protein
LRSAMTASTTTVTDWLTPTILPAKPAHAIWDRRAMRVAPMAKAALRSARASRVAEPAVDRSEMYDASEDEGCEDANLRPTDQETNLAWECGALGAFWAPLRWQSPAKRVCTSSSGSFRRSIERKAGSQMRRCIWSRCDDPVNQKLSGQNAPAR